MLIGPDHAPIASGAFDWENRLENGIWTYRLEDVWAGFKPPTGDGPAGEGKVRHGAEAAGRYGLFRHDAQLPGL